MNFFEQDLLGTPQAWAYALVIGAAFGFWLERAGFGSSRKLTAMFFLRDFAVLQVMFTAIVTALVVLHVLGLFGWVDVTHVYRTETVLAPQIVGGLVFGVGFVAGGWCPGTALVGVASGKLDALVFLGGAMLGSVAYAFALPSLAGFTELGACGISTLPEWLGISPTWIVIAVVAMAVSVFVFLERWQKARAA
ncbi:MAG: YeeE/YedE family protein [Planctomycetes bacterium]|nr:YeeE/YedE family protein [Planctomycetota bacterium]